MVLVSKSMVRVITKMAVVASLVLGGVAFGELKIAVLDTQRALMGSAEAKTLVEGHRKALEQEENDVKSLAEGIRAKQERLQKDAEVMSTTEKRKMAKEIEDGQIEYQFKVNKLQKDVNDRQQEMLQTLLPKVDAVLKDLIELEGYDIIMERSNLRYVNQKHDITRKVTEKLNERQ